MIGDKLYLINTWDLILNVIFVDDGLCSRRKDSNYDMIMRRGCFFVVMMRSLSFFLLLLFWSSRHPIISLEEVGREYDWPNDGVVLASEVVDHLLLTLGLPQLVELHHLALVADCLHVVLIVVTWLKECPLQQSIYHFLVISSVENMSALPTVSRFIKMASKKGRGKGWPVTTNDSLPLLPLHPPFPQPPVSNPPPHAPPSMSLSC